MRGSAVVVALMLGGLVPSLAADLDRDDARHAGRYGSRARVDEYGFRRDVYGYGYGPPPLPGPVVVAPRPYTLLVPRPAPPPPLRYAPPPVYPEPPPLIAAIPIVGPYLIPREYGPPPATVFDAYDHRYDYNQ